MFILIDNHDSFTFNLYQYFLACGVQISVVNTDLVDLGEIRSMNPRGIIISPGPGHPAQLPHIISLIQSVSGEIPILGVCLGFQAIGYAFGGSIIEGKEPVHGKVFPISHQHSDLFADVPSPLNVTRYHSLILDSNKLPPQLFVTATTGDGTVMGIRHVTHPTYGVQFHPEAILTERGIDIIQNFIQMCP